VNRTSALNHTCRCRVAAFLPIDHRHVTKRVTFVPQECHLVAGRADPIESMDSNRFRARFTVLSLSLSLSRSAFDEKQMSTDDGRFVCDLRKNS
jgi:hypothetical protein